MRKNQLAIDMTYLASDDRVRVIKGTILRRLPEGTALSKEQLETAVECDMDAIKQKWSGFDHNEYVGMDVPTLYKSMLIGMLINERIHASESVPVVERGSQADDFLKSLPDDLQIMIEFMPMSTRGLFDNLRVRPQNGKTIRLSAEEFNEAHRDGDKKVIIDDSHLNPMQRSRDSVVDAHGNGLISP